MNEESRPEAASEDLAGGLIYTEYPTDYFTPRKISEAAGRTINQWVDELCADTMSLVALPASLFALYQLGVRDGRMQREPEVRAAKLEADRLWLISFGEKERKAYLLDRLDRAAELANRPDVDDVLDEAWRLYCASLGDVRAAVSV